MNFDDKIWNLEEMKFLSATSQKEEIEKEAELLWQENIFSWSHFLSQ